MVRGVVAMADANHSSFTTVRNPQASIRPEEYSANLGKFVKGFRAVHGTRIVVKPLIRRQFEDSPPRIVESLAWEKNATIAVVESLRSWCVDQGKDSEDCRNAVGPYTSWK